MQVDRIVKARALNQCLVDRSLVSVDRFLRPETCNTMAEELNFAFWQSSTVVSRALDGSLRHHRSPARVSETASQEWFTTDLTRAIRSLEKRLSCLLDRPTDRFEPWQAVRYRRGGRFGFHNDAGYWAGEPAGEREITVLLYLQAPDQGGGTHFRDLNVMVAASAGRLVVWNNLLADGTCNPRMVHAGVPVRKGRKCIITTWIRQRPVRVLPSET